MTEMTGSEFELAWDGLILKLSKQFNVTAEFEFILFIVGVQELGQGFKNFSRSEKMDLMNLARCRILARKGYLKENGLDEQGWPKFDILKSVNSMMPSFQNQIIRKGIIEYFNEIDLHA